MTEPRLLEREGELPRLLYVADVPVRSTYHGSALVYRLLEEYPPWKLLIVEGGASESVGEKRLTGVRYLSLPVNADRWRFRKFSRWCSEFDWLGVKLSRGAMRLQDLCSRFEPEAVLTVAHGYSWITGAQFAKHAGLSLHMIVHDDWPTMTSGRPWMRALQSRDFGQVYCQAISRLCVSPFMEQEYRRKYGASGQVLYPSRARDCPVFDHSPETFRKENGAPVAAYAGSIFHGYGRLIVRLAEILERRAGRLLLFGDHSVADLRFWGLDRANVLRQGFVDSRELVGRLRKEADFVFLPMAFESDGRPDIMRLSFPSKLADYTATELPLLICGPAYCSAVRWAQQYDAVAEVVTSQAPEDLNAAVNRLEQRTHRERLGQAAAHLGNRLFSHRAAVDVLYGALRSEGPHECVGLATQQI